MKIVIPRQILAIIALSVAFNVVRVVWSDTIYFLYLIWNIFLAFIPFVISLALLWYSENKKMDKAFYIVGGIIWLFMFPNAPYLVTDMIHLKLNSIVPLWYDALLLFSTAWAGILLSVYSLSHIEKIIINKYSKQKTNIILTLIILLSSFGIYIGRFLRWNSWDIVTNPSYILKDVWNVLSHPSAHIEGYIFTLSFFIFILISYQAWKFSQEK